MTRDEIVSDVLLRVSGQMSASEVSALVASAMRDLPAQVPHADLPQAQEVIAEAAIDSASSEFPSGEERREVEEQEQPCCFLCQYDYDLGELTIRDPYVVLPDGTVEIPDVPTLSAGNTYYCVVTRKEGEEADAYEAEITDESESGEDVVVCVPICMIDNEEGFVTVRQYHVGAVIVGATGVRTADGSGLLVTGSGELDLVDREEDDEFAVRGVSTTGGDTDVRFLASRGLAFIGGRRIKVDSPSDGTVKISYDEDKEDEDDDPNGPEDDPCVHPGDDDNGGGTKPARDDGHGGVGGGGSGGGGVGPGVRGEPHIGDNGCQGPGC